MKPVTIVILAILAVIIGGSAYAYFTFISSSPEKPLLEQPSTAVFARDPNASIEVEHVQYLATELGAYKLHNDPFTKEPAIMEFHVIESGENFTITVKDGKPKVTKGRATNPDLRVHGKKQVLIELFNKQDPVDGIVPIVEKGDIWIEVLGEEATLAMKGYKGIYDTIKKETGTPTAQVIRAFRQT